MTSSQILISFIDLVNLVSLWKIFCQNRSNFRPCSCFRCRTLAALVIIFLTMMLRTDMTTAAPYSPTSGTRGDIQCSVQSDQSFSFRSQCQDNGFLTVNRNKVFVQTSGLSQTHVDGKDLCSSQLSLCVFSFGGYLQENRLFYRNAHIQT